MLILVRRSSHLANLSTEVFTKVEVIGKAEVSEGWLVTIIVF
jgi:hypothetical protein